MEKRFSVKGILFTAMLLASVVILPSCGDDDDNNGPKPAQPSDIAGLYNGEMYFAKTGAEVPDTVAIEKLNVTTDTIAFDKFPVEALIKSIIPGEGSDAVVKAIGDVKYKVGYAATVAKADSSFAMTLTPKPLEIIFALEEGAKSDTVNVEVLAADKGLYTIKNKALDFKLTTGKITLNGKDVSSLTGGAISLEFDLKK